MGRRLDARATRARTSGAVGRVVGAWLLAIAYSAPAPLGAQGHTVLGIRGGAGFAPGGEPVYAGQIELIDMDGGSSVELAVTAWSGLHLLGEYAAGNDVKPAYAYPEELRIWGGGITASYLWRHARRNGPYALLGIGVGSVWVDWRVDTTDPLFGTPVAGGSFRAEEGIALASLLSVGIGHRLHDRFDLRAQVLAVLVPGTDLREDVKKVPLFTLSSGLGL